MCFSVEFDNFSITTFVFAMFFLINFCSIGLISHQVNSENSTSENELLSWMVAFLKIIIKICVMPMEKNENCCYSTHAGANK